jgi:L,D-peptidoglycan transpeptidase YkuD (ErfK/YbiS/YcfS/YnhG family)
VAIDYNTRNAGPVVQNGGSAVFLHVHPPGTGPTAGCVSIPQDQVVRILKWLEPADHPRILIGLA